LTLIVGVGLWTVSPGSMRTLAATAAQFLVGAAMCVLLTDILFLNITTVAFTGEPERGEPNLAFTVLKYFTFFPVVAALPSYVEPWMEMSLRHLIAAVVITAGSHIALRVRHRENLRQHCNLPGLEDDEEDFPMKLGLRY
jgi:phosphate starvation-inducible membrane PsiE